MSVPARLFASSKPRLVLALASGIGSGVCVGVLVSMTQRIASGIDVPTTKIMWTFGVLAIAHVIARMVSLTEVLTLLQLRVMPAFRYDGARSIVAAPQRMIEQIGPGRLLGSLTADTFAVGMASNAWIVIAHSASAILVCLLSIAMLRPLIFFVVITTALVALVVFQLLAGRARKEAVRAQEARTTLDRRLDAVVAGAKELLLDPKRRVAFLKEGLEPALDAYHRKRTLASASNDIAAAWARLLMFVLIGVLLFLWPLLVPTPMPILAAAAVATLYVQAELSTIFEYVPHIVRGEVVLRSNEALGITLKSNTHDETTPVQPSFERLDLVDVTHRYRGEDGDEFVLGPIDMSLSRGEVVFVIGGNGSGKSTLAKLLVGFYPPESGEIRIDEKPVSADSMERFSAIFADYWIFDRLYGVEPNVADERATAALERLKMSKIVRVEGGRFSTTDLSQGQKKRLALVATSVEDRPITVFDEWASDQDPEFKNIFYTQILPELKAKGRTAVVITHDERYLHCADRVIRLRDGKLVSADSAA